jgi:hypothetical protein
MPPVIPGLGAYEKSVRPSTADLVAALRDVLGAKLVAYLGSVDETRVVRQWAEGGRAPSNEVVSRLMLAYQVASLISAREQPRVVQAWFQGVNPQLDDVSPARLVREAELGEAGPRILAAARSFVDA